ncbi:phosphatase PAP2 family protein [Streptococcus dentasini]
MHNRQKFFIRASFAALIFVILGYIVKFDPRLLQGFDRSLQSAIRGHLPAPLTAFFRWVTVLGDTPVQGFLVLASLVIFIWKKWYAEAGLVLFNGILAGIGIALFKNIYQRPRPSLSHLVVADGYSFPSGHSMGIILILGSLLIIAHQRIQSRNQRRLAEALLALLIFLVGLSRIYLGVHYPTDVIAGFVLGYGVLCLGYPFYDEVRFEWRFKSKQK